MDFSVIDRKFQDAFIRVKQDIQGLQDHSERLEGSISAVKQGLSTIDELSAAVNDLKNKGIALESSIEENEQSIISLEGSIKKGNRDFDERIAALEQVKKTLGTLNADVIKLNNFLEDFASNVAYKTELQELQKESKGNAAILGQDLRELRKEVQANKAGLGVELNSLGNSLEGVRKDIRQANSRIDAISRGYVTLDDFNKRAVNENKEINDIWKKLTALEKSRNSASKRIAGTKKSVAALRAETRKMIKSRDFSRRVQAVVKRQIIAGLRNLKVKSELERKAKRQLLKAMRQRKESALTNMASYLEGKR